MLGWFAANASEKGREAFIGTARHSDYGRLLQDIFDAAKAYAKSKGMSPDDFKELLNHAAELSADLRAACCSYCKGEDDTKLDFLPQGTIRLNNLKPIEMASYSREEIEPYVERYLRLPFRSPVMERTLAKLLMWYEPNAFERNAVLKAESNH
jgi:hypothetical protein